MQKLRKCEQKSAGVIVRRGEKILLLDRAFFPFGWACPAGHIKAGEAPMEGMRREAKEETGLVVVKPKLVFTKKNVQNKCVKGSMRHDWWVFDGFSRGSMRINKYEAKNIGWFSPEEIKKMKLEPIWRRWFRGLKII